MKSKKVLSVILSFAMLLSLFSCANSGGSPANSNESNSSPDTSEEVYIMKICHDEVIDSPQDKAMHAFKDYVESESDGRLQVEIFANGELGAGDVLVEMIHMGQLQGTGYSSGQLSSFNEKLSFLQLPFLFDNYDQIQELVFNKDGLFHQMYQEMAIEAGFYVLGFQYDGLRHFSNNTREVLTAEDMKGLKVRVPNITIFVDTFASLGCNPVSMSLSELYTALQQGVVDGQDNPVALTYANKFNEVQKYYSTIGHNAGIAVFVTNYEWLMSLPEDLRELVLYAGEEFGAKQQREMVHAQEEEYLAKIEESGCKVTVIEDKSSFIETTASVYDAYREIYGDEFMDKILAAVGR